MHIFEPPCFGQAKDYSFDKATRDTRGDTSDPGPNATFSQPCLDPCPRPVRLTCILWGGQVKADTSKPQYNYSTKIADIFESTQGEARIRAQESN